MSSFNGGSHQIVIAGASSLLGAELKSLLEESRFAGWDLQLVDEEVAAGTLTEAAGEPAVIQPVDEETFKRARFLFFTGSFEFTLEHFEMAQRSGATIIDLSGHSISFANTYVWYPGRENFTSEAKPQLAAIPSVAAQSIARLSRALQEFGLSRLAAVVLQPVSAAGKAGIEELETQTTQLLSFQQPGKAVFDAQVAFNTLDRFGPARQAKSQEARSILRNEISACLRGVSTMPAVDLIHVPVFYGVTFSACAELSAATNKEQLAEACKRSGFVIMDEWGIGPSNMTAAGETSIQLTRPHADPLRPGAWWLWGAADNIRLPAANAVKLAEMLA